MKMKEVELTEEEAKALEAVFTIAYQKIDNSLMEYARAVKEAMPEDLEKFNKTMKPVKCRHNVAVEAMEKLGFQYPLDKFLNKKEREEALKDRVERITGIRPEIGKPEE